MRVRRIARRLLLALALVAGASVAMPQPALAVTCRTSGPSSGAFTVTVCVTTPVPGAVLSGPVPVTATVTVSGDWHVRWLEFFLDSEYVLTDFQSPFTFTLPTERWPDGSHVLKAQAVVAGSPDWVSLRTLVAVTFDNPGDPPPVPTFSPRSPSATPGQPLVVAGVADGASGRSPSRGVIDLIASWDPDLLLYAGDVYQEGTQTEFYNWWGSGVLQWARFDSITNPAPGNHEYGTPGAAGYFDYWGDPSHHYSYDAGGWHFISLDSTPQFDETAPGSAQYEWLLDDLVEDPAECTIVYFHHAPFSLGDRVVNDRMMDIWQLLASRGVDMVVTGHEHNYVRWKPMNAAGKVVPVGTTEFVVGTGGHYLYDQVKSDPRVAQRSEWKYGALRLELSEGSATFEFVGTGGATLDSGGITCSPVVDDEAPSPPTDVVAEAVSHDEVDLTWTASTDNDEVAGYRIVRDGQVIATIDPHPTSYSDMSVEPSTTYSYVVRAFDPSGNTVDSSPPVEATTPVEPDVTPPSPPPNLTATATSMTSIHLEWDPSTDDRGVVGYDVYRDGALLGSTPTLEWDDGGLSPGTSHDYEVRARDAVGNVSGPSSVTGTTLDVLFRDGFESGDLSKWTAASGLAVQTELVYGGTYAARQTSTGRRTFAYEDLASPEVELFARARVNLVSRGSNGVNILRFRRADGSSLVTLFVTNTGLLAFRDDVATKVIASNIPLPKGEWHELQLRVVVSGGSSRVEVWFDGGPVPSLSRTVSLGSAGIGRVQIGDSTTGRTYDMAIDDVAVDTVFIPSDI